MDVLFFLQEASQGFHMVEQLARSQGALRPGDMVGRVVLADEKFGIKTGGGKVYTQRQRCNDQNDADVFIDARRPLINAVLNWADTAHERRVRVAQARSVAAGKGKGKTPPRSLIFDTTNEK